MVGATLDQVGAGAAVQPVVPVAGSTTPPARAPELRRVSEGVQGSPDRPMAAAGTQHLIRSTPILLALAASLALVAAEGSHGTASRLCMGEPATIVGTSGDDQLNRTGGDDVIFGDAGNDRTNSSGGNDLICGVPITVPQAELVDARRPGDAAKPVPRSGPYSPRSCRSGRRCNTRGRSRWPPSGRLARPRSTSGSPRCTP